MAIDPARLTQSELLQLVNATPLGAVLTRSRLRRQMDAGALRFGDGTHIHLVRYVRWLVGELDKPRPAKMDYTEARRRQPQRNRAATKAAQDIYPVPEVADFDRRNTCGDSFKLFCQTYFPRAFWRPWSEDHLRVIAKIEKAVREGGLFAFAMPRGSGKTALARCAALWAVLYGYRPFVCMIADSQDNARELLRPIRIMVLGEPLLPEDFPEAVHPFRCLENSSKRQLVHRTAIEPLPVKAELAAGIDQAVIGNVAEWTTTAWQPPKGIIAPPQVVAKGGSWRDRPKTTTPFSKMPARPEMKFVDVGFRVVIVED